MPELTTHLKVWIAGLHAAIREVTNIHGCSRVLTNSEIGIVGVELDVLEQALHDTIHDEMRVARVVHRHHRVVPHVRVKVALGHVEAHTVLQHKLVPNHVEVAFASTNLVRVPVKRKLAVKAKERLFVLLRLRLNENGYAVKRLRRNEVFVVRVEANDGAFWARAGLGSRTSHVRIVCRRVVRLRSSPNKFATNHHSLGELRHLARNRVLDVVCQNRGASCDAVNLHESHAAQVSVSNARRVRKTGALKGELGAVVQVRRGDVEHNILTAERRNGRRVLLPRIDRLLFTTHGGHSFVSVLLGPMEDA